MLNKDGNAPPLKAKIFYPKRVLELPVEAVMHPSDVLENHKDEIP